MKRVIRIGAEKTRAAAAAGTMRMTAGPEEVVVKEIMAKGLVTESATTAVVTAEREAEAVMTVTMTAIGTTSVVTAERRAEVVMIAATVDMIVTVRPLGTGVETALRSEGEMTVVAAMTGIALLRAVEGEAAMTGIAPLHVGTETGSDGRVEAPKLRWGGLAAVH
mmetsp:Transcript_120773/g.225781  ORF Transcript_120773/g.225781 Transcript_120773/m.225781 type:complete len:165 (-) Transcript_120773:121-615(-)